MSKLGEQKLGEQGVSAEVIFDLVLDGSIHVVESVVPQVQRKDGYDKDLHAEWRVGVPHVAERDVWLVGSLYHRRCKGS